MKAHVGAPTILQNPVERRKPSFILQRNMRTLSYARRSMRRTMNREMRRETLELI